MKPMLAIAASTLMVFSSASTATKVYKCIAADGSITYSQVVCPGYATPQPSKAQTFNTAARPISKKLCYRNVCVAQPLNEAIAAARGTIISKTKDGPITSVVIEHPERRENGLYKLNLSAWNGTVYKVMASTSKVDDLLAKRVAIDMRKVYGSNPNRKDGKWTWSSRDEHWMANMVVEDKGVYVLFMDYYLAADAYDYRMNKPY